MTKIETQIQTPDTRRAETSIDQYASMAADMAGLGYWHFDGRALAQGDGFTWSGGMYRIYGLDPAEGPPNLNAIAEFCHPDDREKLAQHRETSKGRDAEIGVRIIRADGEIRHVIARSTVKVDDDGVMISRFGTLIDITEMKRAEAAALESEQRYRFLAEYAPDMITRQSTTGRIYYVSPSSERVFGYTPGEMMSISPIDMIHPDDIPIVMAAIGSMVESRTTRLPEPLCYRAKNKGGEWIWIESNPIMIMDEHGEPIEFVDIIRNVTQTKLFEAELEEATRKAEAGSAAKSAFLANMSHELRTPLTSIIGFSQLMSDQSDLPEQAKHYARRISDASGALLSIINDVLDFSKLEAGQAPLENQPVSVRKLADEAIGLIAIQAAAKGVEVRIEFDPCTPEYLGGDEARLRQVLLNLLSNAVKFTDRGAVTVRTRWRGGKTRGRLTVSVIDTGSGIAPENVGRLFERFTQAEVSINRTHGGTGLGLAICKGIVELMGGEVGVESEVGKGSTFWFSIPARAARQAVQDAPAVLDVQARTTGGMAIRLLVVDDTAVNREIVRLMLEPVGVEIEEASGGAEGIKAAMTRPFDLILMDVRMPGVDGLEATRVIRATSQANRDTPILALTADVQSDNAQACRAAGMDDVMAKPIVPRELLSKIAQWSQQGPPGPDARRPGGLTKPQ